MVHTFTFKYKEKCFYFLWDVESGSLSVVDKIAFLYAKNRYESLDETELLEFSKVDADVSKELEAEFDELEKENILNSKPLLTEFKKNADHIKALCLHICHDCNLRCKYCFAKDGTYNTERDYMSYNVGKNAIDLLIANSGSRENLEVDFFGGEPLMNLQVVKDIVKYATEQAKIFKKKFAFTMTTNCVLLNDDNIKWLNEVMDNIVLSIDGRKEVHDAVRLTPNGKSAYNTILKNSLAVKDARGDKKYYVRGTFTADNLDFASDILELNDQGFDQISIEPVVLPDESPMALKECHIPSIVAEYEKLATEYIERRNNKSGKWFNFFHFMIDLEHGPCPNKRLTGCGAGTEYLAVTPTGDIYPCHQFVGIDGFKLGDVFSGVIRQDIREDFANVNVLNKKHCEDCFAKYYCGGGCVANAYNFTQNLSGQYKIGCELTKKRLELSLAIACIEKML